MLGIHWVQKVILGRDISVKVVWVQLIVLSAVLVASVRQWQLLL